MVEGGIAGEQGGLALAEPVEPAVLQRQQVLRDALRQLLAQDLARGAAEGREIVVGFARPVALRQGQQRDPAEQGLGGRIDAMAGDVRCDRGRPVTPRRWRCCDIREPSLTG